MPNLTKELIDKTTYEGANGSRHVLWDDEVHGFGLRVYPSGKKSFILNYRTSDGRKRMMSLGYYGALTLQKARSLAQLNLGQLKIDGKDPLAERQKAARGETMADLAESYLQRHALVHKKSSRDDKRKIDQHILPRWKNRQVKSILRAEIATLHHEIGIKTPYEANRTLALLSKMFELAKRWGFLEEIAPNPARGIDRFKEHKRDRWITPEEMPRLAEAIAQEQNKYAQAAIWLYLLIGVRKSELLKTKWEDLDFNRAELRLPETKAERIHYIPLSSSAINFLKRLPRQANNPYLLPGRREGQHLVNISKPWNRIRKAACMEDVRIHDLRRTVGSWLAQSGHTLNLIGAVLNHSNPSTTKIYARFGQDHVREALEVHGKSVLVRAGIQAETTEKSS